MGDYDYCDSDYDYDSSEIEYKSETINFEWQQIGHMDNKHYSFRAKVYGGWIVRNINTNGDSGSESSVFVPDQHHQWEI